MIPMMTGLLASRLLGNLYDEIIADSPWAYYQLGETAGATTYVDSSANGYDLTAITATVTAGSAAICAPGTSVDFSGGYISSTNNQYGAAQAATFNGTGALTMVFVVNVDSLAASRVPFHLGNASVANSQGAFVELRTNGAVRFQMFVGAEYKILDSPASAISAGNSYIIHARRNALGGGTIWVNGVQVASGDLSGSLRMNATASSGGQRIMVGALNAATPANAHDGRLQHVAIFNSALSDSRIAIQADASGL